MKRQNAAGKPFFVWLNTTHMHLFTHTKPTSKGQAGRWQSPYHDTMIDHDRNVGDALDCLDELGIADNTFVMYSTDNGPHMNSWPDGGMTPFRSEKNTNWEGAFRVPALVRWPGRIKPGSISNEIVQHHDWFPTLLAMAGDPDVVDKLKSGYQAIGRTYKNHIDGYNLVPYLTGEASESPRKLFVYLSDDGDVLGVRYDNWKVVFMEQRCVGTMQVWAEPFTRAQAAKALQPAHGPFRARRPDIEHLLRLVPASPVFAVCRMAYHGPVGRNLQGFPAGPASQQLHDRRGFEDAVSGRIGASVAAADALGAGAGERDPRHSNRLRRGGHQPGDVDHHHSRRRGRIRLRRPGHAGVGRRAHPARCVAAPRVRLPSTMRPPECKGPAISRSYS